MTIKAQIIYIIEMLLSWLLLENVPHGNKADKLETQPGPSNIPQIQKPSETVFMLESGLINPRCFHP